MLIDQVEFCDVLVINKIDLVTPEELEKLERVLKQLQPEAKIIKTVKAEVELSEVLNTHRFDFEKASNSAGWIKELTEGGHETHTPKHIRQKLKNMGFLLSFIQEDFLSMPKDFING